MEREVPIDQFDVEIVLEPPDTHGAEITPGSDVVVPDFKNDRRIWRFELRSLFQRHSWILTNKARLKT